MPGTLLHRLYIYKFFNTVFKTRLETVETRVKPGSKTNRYLIFLFFFYTYVVFALDILQFWKKTIFAKESSLFNNFFFIDQFF